MSETIKIWLLDLFNYELEETDDNIKNNTIWKRGSNSPDEALLFEENLSSLTEYKDILLRLITRVEDGTLNI